MTNTTIRCPRGGDHTAVLVETDQGQRIAVCDKHGRITLA